MYQKLSFLLAFVFVSTTLFAQSNQSILLMTGKVLEGNVTGQDTSIFIMI